MLSLRDVSELLLMRGINVSHETIREWSLIFGTYANEIKRRVLRRGDKWHMDEMCLVMKEKKHWLWRAVDQDGYELDIFTRTISLWRRIELSFNWCPGPESNRHGVTTEGF